MYCIILYDNVFRKISFLVLIIVIIIQPMFICQSITTIQFPSGTKPTQVCVNELTNKVYLTDYPNSRVFEIDGITKNILRIFQVPLGPHKCIVNPVSNKLYVYCQVELMDQYFVVIDLNSGVVDSFYTNESGYYGLFANFVLNSKLNKIYFLVVWNLWVYDGNTNLLKKVDGPVVFNGPVWVGQLGIDTTYNKVYVPNGGGNVMVIDCLTDMVTKTVVIDSDMYARVNIATVNQEKSLLFVAAWNDVYVKIFSTIDEQYMPPIIDEGVDGDLWQSATQDKLNLACRSNEIDSRIEIVDMENHLFKKIELGGQNGRLVAINQDAARAYYVYSNITIIYDLLSGRSTSIPVGTGYETVSFALQLGGFNKFTNELYVPDRVNGVVNVITDDELPVRPHISNILLNSDRSLIINGSGFGVMQGTSKVFSNNYDLGGAEYWSADSLFFSPSAEIGTSLITVNVLDETSSFMIPTFSKNIFDFGSTTVGTTSNLHYFVKNLATDNLIISNIFSTNSAFDINPKSADINPDSVLIFTVSFSPSMMDLQTGNLIFVHNGLSSPDTLKVKGIGIELTIRQIIDREGDGGFENGTTFASNGWIVANLSPAFGISQNSWYVGSATKSGGFLSAYISNDDGVTNSYSTISNIVPIVYFYRDVTFLISDSIITLKFDWRCQGEKDLDYMRIYLVNTNVTPVAGTEILSGWIGEDQYNLQAIYKLSEVIIDNLNRGKTKRLVFSWKNSFLNGVQPPIAIDNISLISTVAVPLSVDTKNNLLPPEFQLNQNFPNPFNNSTIISYSVPKKGMVLLRVYDILGKDVFTLVNEEKPTGIYEVKFDASGLSSGIYFYQINAGNFRETKKMILIK